MLKTTPLPRRREPNLGTCRLDGIGLPPARERGCLKNLLTDIVCLKNNCRI